MKVSLNELVSMLSDRVGQPFSIPLQEELKVILNYKRAEWFHKLIDKHPEQRKFYFKEISVPLEAVDKAECLVSTDCTVLRTTETIPRPVRASDTLFDYVGDPDKSDGYTYTTPEQLYWIIKYGSKYTLDRPKYFYINDYVYIYNEDSLENVNIRGVWADQRGLGKFKCNGVPCYTDNDQWDVPDDLINTMIQDILRNELRILISPEVDEVVVDKKDN